MHLLSILQMTLHNPTVLKESIRTLIVAQIDTLASIPHDIPCSRHRRGPIPHTLLEIGDIVRRNAFRARKHHRDRARHADLVRLQIRVALHQPISALFRMRKRGGGTHIDESPRGAVHALTYEVPAQTSLFALQPCANGFDGPSGLLQSLTECRQCPCPCTPRRGTENRRT